MEGGKNIKKGWSDSKWSIEWRDKEIKAMEGQRDYGEEERMVG